MMRNWMIAAACAVALGVAGCSGANAPAPSGPTDPSGPAAPAPDGGTDGQAVFEAELMKAEDAQAAAERLVEAAEMAAGDVGTDEARTAARDAIKAARDALAKAVDDARALTALAQGDANLRGRAVDRIGKAEAAQRAGEAKLAAGEAGIAAAQATATQWSARAGVARLPVPAFPEVRAVRRIRTNAAGTADNVHLLTAASFPAVPYAQGKVLISEGEASSGDLLRMRGFHPSYVHDQHRGFRTEYNGALGDGRFTFFVGGLRITGAGLVMAVGGANAEGIDFRRTVDERPSALSPANPDTRGWDLTLTFGGPTVSPEGNGEAYWEAWLMPDPGQIVDGADPENLARLLVDGRPYPVGTYKVWLSNHAGVEENLEPAGGGGSYPEDDDNTFLKYAAYGMKTFQASDRSPYNWDRQDRVHGFHVGYDAFANENNKKTTDFGEVVSEGKFTGLTIAFELNGISRGYTNAPASIDLRTAQRLRGEIELTATISETSSSNRISGKIGNLEVWDSRGYWKDYATVPADITLGSGSIGANGQYGGTTTGVTGFSDGRYAGAFYGPVSDLETAGAWYVNGAADVTMGNFERALIGSFGAKPAPAE